MLTGVPSQHMRASRKNGAARPGSMGNNYILIIFDSCRYDTLVEARPRTICKLGSLEQRWSYASSTAPSDYNLLSGLLPHSSPTQVFASEYYKKDFLMFTERLSMERIRFKIINSETSIAAL